MCLCATPPPLAFLQPQGNDCKQSHDRSHKLQRIDICVGDVSIVPNMLEEVWDIKRVPSHSWNIEPHANTMLCTHIHEYYVISQGCSTVHPLDCIFTRLIAQRQWDADGEYEPTSVMKPELQDHSPHPQIRIGSFRQLCGSGRKRHPFQAG